MPGETLNIVVLGASYAGLAALHNIIQHVIPAVASKPKKFVYRVVVISPSSHLYWNISAAKAAISKSLISHEQSFIPIQYAFQRYSTEVLTWLPGVATDLDLKSRVVTIATMGGGDGSVARKRAIGHCKAKSSLQRDLHKDVPFFWHEGVADDCRNAEIKVNYHALIFATGSTSHSPLMSLRGPHDNTRDALDAFQARLVNAKTVIVAGGGPSGVELAGQIAYHSKQSGGVLAIPDLRGLSKKKQNSSEDSLVEDGPFIPLPRFGHKKHQTRQVILISSSPRLLPKLDASLGEKAKCQLEGLGVTIITSTSVQKVNVDGDSGKVIVKLDTGRLMSCDLYTPCTGVTPNTQYLPQASPLLEEGYIKTNASLRVSVPDHLLPGVKGQALSACLSPRSRFSSSTIGSEDSSADLAPRLYALGDCASYSTNCITDIYAAIPVLMRNLTNDLLAYQLQIGNPYGGNSEDIAELHRSDAVYVRDKRTSQLVPIGGRKPGGVGILLGRRLPGMMVWFFKGRDYMLKKSRDVVEKGASPYKIDNRKALAP